MEADTPLNVTVPVVVPKFWPLIVTLDPIGPATGLNPVIVGVEGTENVTELLRKVDSM
jgi:hypothetical protein